MADNVEQLEARRWIDSLDDKWRLQILSKRQRLNLRTGERKDMPTRIRRFVEGMPWAFVVEGVRYLISKAPYRGIMFNGVRLDEEYRPTLTVWQRDAQDTVNSPVQRGGDSTYTLIQDLIAVDEEDLYGAVTSASCSEEVVSEWHWDEAQPGDIPQPTQGVTWQIAQVNRKEDGTFDYALVKRTALTQHTGETVVKDTTAELVRADSWNNVYTDDQGRYTDNYGNLLDIPESHHGDGVACEVTRQINDDCTFRVNAQWTESKDATVRESCQKTQFEHEHSVSKVGQAEPLGEAPEASGGVVKRHEDQLQPDGRYSTVENTQTELPVEKARVRVTVGRRGRRVERTDRNQPTPASTEGLDIGQSVEVEKTPGKLYNNTTVNFDLSEKQRVAESCEIDLFKHDHSETIAGVDEIPGINEHVEGSGQNGDVKTRRTEMDDEGSVSQTNAVHHEKEVLKHRETWQVGLRGVRHSVTDTQTSPENVPPPPSYSKENIGKSVSVEKTPGGLVNITTEDTARETPLDAGEGCGKTVFEHRDTTITNDPDGGFQGHVPDAGDGKYYENQSRLNEDGTSTVEQTEHKELEYPASEVEIRRTAKAVYRTTTDKNVKRTAQEPEGIGTSRHTTNPGGTHDVTTTTVDILNLPDRAHCAQTVFEHQHDKVEVSKGTQADSTDTPQAGGGHHYSKESSVDDMGVVTTVLRDTHELEKKTAARSKRKSRYGVVETVTDRNTTDSSVEVENIGDEVRVEMTPGGLYNRTVTTAAREDLGVVARACEKNVFQETDSRTDNKKDDPGERHADAGGGKYGSKSARMTDMGTWDVTDSTTTETEQESGRSKRKTRYGVVETTVTRNTPNNDVEVENIGDEVRVEMTPGGLYNRTETTASKEDVGTIARTCEKNVFQETDSTTDNKKDDPGERHAEAGGGKYGSKSARMTDMGTWDVTDSTTTETEQESGHSKRKTRYGVVETTVTRNTSNNDVEVENIGDEVRVEMTPGGLYNRTETTASKEDVGTIARTCEKNVFQETDSHTDNRKNDPGERHAEAGGGQYGSKSARMTDMGTWDVTDATTTETEQGWTYDQRKTLRGLRITTIKRNTPDNSTDTPNVGDEVHLEMTPGGRYNRTETKLSVVTGLAIRDAYVDTHHEHGESHTRIGAVSEAARDEIDIGERTSSDSRQNDDGSWDNTSEERTGQAQSISLSYTSVKQSATYKWWINQQPGYSQGVASQLDDRKSNSISAQINDFGLENGSCSSGPPGRAKDGDDDFVSWGWNVFKVFPVTIRTTINHSDGPHSYELKAQRLYAEGIWEHYWNAFSAWKRVLEGEEIRGVDTSGFDLSRMTFGPFTLASGNRCYRISFMSPPIPRQENGKVFSWEKKN